MNNTFDTTATLRNIDLEALMDRLAALQERKEDLIVPAASLRMRGGRLTIDDVPLEEPDRQQLQLDLAGLGVTVSRERLRGGRAAYRVTRHAHGQLADPKCTGIGRTYYNRMLRGGHLELLDENVNYWLGELARAGRRLFIRTYRPASPDEAGVVRAVLSTRYAVLDNYHVALTALKALRDLGLRVGTDIAVEAADLTPSKMYVRFVAPSIEAQAPELLRSYRVPGGHRRPDNPYGIVSGFVLSNSEVGDGGLYVTPRAVVLACANGLTLATDRFKRIHLGSRLSGHGVITWSKATRRQNMRLVESQVRDAVRTFLSPEYLGRVVDRMMEAAGYAVRHPEHAIANVCSALTVSEEEAEAILRYFIQGGDASAFGVVQAITFAAHEVSSPERQYALEEGAAAVMPRIQSLDRSGHA